VALGLDTTASAYVAVAGSRLVVAKKPRARAPIYLWLLANSRLRPSGWRLQNPLRHEVSRQTRCVAELGRSLGNQGGAAARRCGKRTGMLTEEIAALLIRTNEPRAPVLHPPARAHP
jgi:hypothetical protein